MTKKNIRLSTPTQLQCSRPGAWEPGNEAIIKVYTENTSKHTKSETESVDLKVPQFFKSFTYLGHCADPFAFSNAAEESVCRDREIIHTISLSLNFGILENSQQRF